MIPKLLTKYFDSMPSKWTVRKSSPSILMEKPLVYTHTGSAGDTDYRRLFYAITEDGKLLQSTPVIDSRSNYAHEGDYKKDAPPLHTQWKGEKIKYVVEMVHDYDNWQGGTYTNEEYGILHILNIEMDEIKRLKRRCRDALNKCHDINTILQVAQIFGIDL